MTHASYPINEIFASIQGEGLHTGQASVFVRFQGCTVGCSWCDTKHTWERDVANLIPIQSMLDRSNDDKAPPAPTWAWMSSAEIARAVGERMTFGVVTITGGEPCEYDLTDLTKTVLRSGYAVVVETSGTCPVLVADGTHVTLSPKLNMTGKKDVLPDAIARADEIKMPIGKQRDLDLLVHTIMPHKQQRAPVFVQPISESKKALALCIHAAKVDGYSLSVQLHKLLGLR